MISNFHTHTWLCKHAAGEPIDYLNAAIRDGCSALGISDHCPYPDDRLWPGSSMEFSEIPLYLSKIGEAKEAAPFPLYWGFECEWHEDYAGWYEALKAEYGADYLVYGAHWVKIDGYFDYIPTVTGIENLKAYVELSTKGIASGVFDLYAHPDLFMAGYRKMDANVKQASIDLIDAAVAMEIPMEINGHGLKMKQVEVDGRLRPPYPVREFWELAAERGARITCSSDAHSPEMVIKNCQAAVDWARSIGIEPLDARVVVE